MTATEDQVERVELNAFAFTITYADGYLVLTHDTCGVERKLAYPASVGLAVMRAARHECPSVGS